jgi:LPPG:FO 2-phospho-L-lactate transferase
MKHSRKRVWKNVVALSGGVGGARLVHGLDRVLPPGSLQVIVNTGDDFEHWGLHISPDVDTVVYTLADLAHVERGWGLAEEFFATLDRVKTLGGDAWFQLGDRDLAMHILRSEWLRKGESLSMVTSKFCAALQVNTRILPMADHPVRTMMVTTDRGELPFQDWFVKYRCEPKLRGIRFDGQGVPTPAVLQALEQAEVIVIGPSNPYVSIDPILQLPGVRDVFENKPVIALSPLVHGQAIKGPLASMIEQLTGQKPSAKLLADHYGHPLRGLVVEHGDEFDHPNVVVRGASTVMKTRKDSASLADELLAFANELCLARPAIVSLHILLPVKSFHRAKSRLASVLTSEQRTSFARYLVESTVRVVEQCLPMSQMIVVSDGDEVEQMAEQWGCRFLKEQPTSQLRSLGLTVDWALNSLALPSHNAVLVLMADLPFLCADELRQLMVMTENFEVVLAPDAVQQGTNALGMHTGKLPYTCFGNPDSYQRHRNLANQQGCTLGVLSSPGLERDIDTPQDYRQWLGQNDGCALEHVGLLEKELSGIILVIAKRKPLG